MATKSLKTRIQHKIDTTANWNLATNFVPLKGEVIVYSDDSRTFKIGDGVTTVGNLPFSPIPAKTQGIFYAQVDSTSTSTNFTVTIPELTATEYYDGLTLLLYNGKVTSASGFTINVNGLGAKPSYSNMALGNSVTPTDPTRDTTIFNINYAMLFTYNSTRVSGGCWICYRGYDANTNTIGYQVRTNNSTLKASDKFYRYRLLFTSADGTKWVPANTSTSTNATSARNVNQRPIDPFGEITWYGTTTAIEANANVTAAQLWQQYYGTYTLIGYSFNNTGAAATMTANRPIYIKCTPQSNGSAIIDANTPYVQALPSTDDGKIYIFLGRAVSATAFEILLNHPVYYHKDGAIRVWTNPQSGGMANPMTALGDMIYGDAGADPIKLSIGTNGQVLTSDGSIPYWATPVDTNTTYTLNVSGTGDNANKVGLVAGGSGSGTTWYTIPYATNAGSANSVAWSNVSGHADGVKTDIGIESSGTTFLRKDGTWATPSGTGMSNPMTTKGDIIVGGTNGDPVRLAGSGTTKFLQSTGGSNGIAISWEDIQGTAIKSGTTGDYTPSGRVLTADGAGGASWVELPAEEKEIFIATYGSTTYSAIALAVGYGTLPLVSVTVNGTAKVGYLCDFDSSEAVFRTPGNDSILVITCSASNNAWSTTTYPYSATEIYQATYGTTTYTDISTADSAGKLCYVKYQGDIYIVSSVSAEGVIFSCATSSAIKTVYVDNQDTWGNQSYAFAAGTVTSVGITNGGGLSVSGSPITNSGSITLSHADTSSQASVSNSGRTYIQSVTLDDYGHVTALSSATETVTDTNTTYTLNVSGTGDNANKVGLVAGGSGSGTVWYTIPYATSANTANSATTAGSATTASTADVANSVAWANISGHADGVKADIGIASSGSTYLKKDGTWDTPTDTNTTYALSGALSSHKFTSTLTAGGSGSGTSTSDFTLAAGSNITLTDDTSNRKITIAATDTDTTYSLTVSGTGDNANKLGLTAGGSGSGTTWVTIPYATSAGSANSVSWSNVSGHADGVKTDIGMTAAGDIIYGGTGGTPTALSVASGDTGKVLTVWADGLPHWDTIHVDTIKNDLTLLKQSNSENPNPGDSYALIFQRGTLTDSYNDWRIQDRGGFLYFDQRGSGSTSWSNQAYINTSGTLYATTFSGSGASLTSLNASNISSGTINVARLPSITSAKVSDFTTAARGALSGTSPISYSSSTGAIGIESTGASSGQVLTADGSGGVSWATPASGGMANPMTTKGDIIVGGDSGAPTRLGKPNATKFLQNTSTGTLTWGDIYDWNINSSTAISGDVLMADGSGGSSWQTPFTGYTSSNKLSTDYINNVAGWTSNAGTVTSVQVQAGTGLTSSQSTAQATTLNTTIGIDNGYKLPTTTEWGKVVLTDTDQSIDGTKTFVERPLYPNTVTLPSGYTQLEYIHSDGTAYINTGRKYSTDDSVELIFQQDDTANYRIWGTFNQSSYAGKNVSMTYSVGWCVRQETRDGQAAMVTFGAIDTKKHTLKILPSGHCYFDGVDYGKSEGWAANFTFSYNAYLFTINPGGTAPTATMKGRVYRYRVWRSGALVQDMYPVKYVSGSTTTYGMYDVINNQYYTNANSSGTLTGAGTPTPTPMVFEDDLSQVAFSGDYNDLNNLPSIPTNYVTTNTAQTVSATKTFTAQQKFQSGSPSGCVVFGANVSATTVSAGTRKLARLTVPTYETNGSSVVGFVSIDNNAYSNGGGNAVEFGSRNGDSTSFGPDLIAFSVATSHNVSTRNNIAQFLPSKVQLFNHASGQTSIQQTPATNLIGMWEFNNNNTFVNNAYTYTLPNTTGTIALTSNIPSVPVTDVQINGTSILSSGVANILTNTAYNSSTNKIATMSDVPSVPSWALESTKPSYSLSEISGTDDLQAIEGLTGTSGLLKKTAANTWALDTSSYLVNPITALGDLIYGNADGSAGTRLAIGTSGKVLTSDGNAPVWGSVTSSGISSGSATSGYVLTADGSGGVSWAAGGGSGTVTSVGGTGSGGISVTGGPITSSGTLTVGIDSGYKLPTTTEWGKVVTATQNNNVTVPGTGAPGGSGATTVVTTYTYDKTRIYTPNGIIIGGTAANSGLVTRGICGVNTPTSDGACTKDNLFLNYDGDNTYRNSRQIVIQAGAVGTHYGSNVYQYCAVRGDALKGWIEGKFPNTTTANKVLLSTTTSGTTAWSNWSTAGLLKTNTSGVVSVDTNAYITNPLTTAGDIFVGGTSGAPDRLGIGSNNTVLQVVNGALSWGGIRSASIDGTGASSGQVLTADGLGSASWQSITHPSDIFEATYGTTTYSDILNAASAGKICIVKYNDLIYELSYNPLTGGVIFTCVSNDVEYEVWVDDTDTWGNSSTNIGTVKKVNNTSPDANGNVSITIPTYNFSGTTFYSGNQNTAEHNANNMTKNGVYYIGSSQNGPPTTLGVQNADSSCHVQAYNDSWVTQLAQDYRDGQIFVRSKKNNVWQPWMAVPFFTTSDGGKGSPTKPVYISNQNQSTSGSTNGQILECTYSLEANVPSNAVFTDTNQTVRTSGVTFSGDDVVEFVGSDNITVTGDASAKTITIGGSDIYVATYGTTTFVQIGLAILSGQLCGVEYQGDVYIISNATGSAYTFSSVSTTNVKTVSVNSSNVWSNQSAPIGGSSVFVATYGTTTYADIVAAYTANKICIVNYNELTYMLSQPDGVSAQFDFTAVANDNLYTISVHSNNTWSNSWARVVKSVNNVTPSATGNVTIPALPTVTSADAGKILTVDSNGNWVAVTMAQWTGGNY